MILEFPTKSEADLCLAAINHIAAIYWQEEGYTVIQTPNGPALVGKNAATGEDNPEALTTTWDVVRESPDGTWYFTDPASDERFSEWEDRAAAAGYTFDFTRKPMPPEWMQSPNE
jgi:hypothetical protein